MLQLRPPLGGIEWKLVFVNILKLLLCIYLPSFICIIVYQILLIKESTVQGHTEIPGGECHRHENGYGNEMMTFRTYGSIQYNQLIGMDAGRYADNRWHVCVHMHSGFPTKMMEQTIVMS